VFLVTA